MNMELIDGSETSGIINQTPGNYPKGNLLYSVHGESLKSRIELNLPILRRGCFLPKPFSSLCINKPTILRYEI